MAQSTEDYLDSLLRQAMGIPDPEPVTKPDETSDLGREDVLAMADGLTGSNSAILGNAYDHNASFTNQGEIETHVASAGTVSQPAAPAEPEAQAVVIPPEDMPDPDAPVAVSKAVETPVFTENLLPDIEPVSTPEPAPEPEPEAIPDMLAPEESITIPDGPIIEHDTHELDIIPGPSMEEIPVSDIESTILSPAIEEPVVEEPVIEEPVVEEPLIEEPVVEEPVIEEPIVELAVPTMSIDDLDPNDASKALDADAIAALFAGANAVDTPIEEPVAEELVPEEPIAEEPVAEAEPTAEEPIEEEIAEEEPSVEEPVIEEPVVEEPVIEEESAPTLSIDDLDPNDASKALDADTIAALFAGANDAEAPAEEPAAEEPAAEEPAAEEPATDDGSENLSAEEIADLLAGGDGEEPSLETLDIPMDDTEETPLMPDQEISDLLSSLGELSGEGEEKAAEEESIETEAEGASEAPAEGVDAGVDLGGLDLFDTDLSAMLDDVTNSIDSDAPQGDGGIVSDDTDLNELLGSLDDGSGDLSDIGNLLDKDENSELVDPNTETAEALFASDSEEELFNIDNLIEEEEEPKRKKKKKFSLFGKKKKKSDNVEVIGGEEEMLIDPDLLDIPDESELKKKKQGFFATLLAKLFEEVDEGDDSASGIEQSAVDIAQEGAAENESILAELDEEEGKGKKKKKEKKKKEKKEKKGKKGGEAESEDGEEAAEEPKKKKKEKKKKEKLPDIPTKKLPRKKVVAISLFCITIGIVITILAFFIPYSQDIEKAKKFYSTGEYQKTYEYMRGHKLTSEDQMLYDRTTTLLRIKRPYDSYQNYMKMGLRIEALNALVQGVQMIDRYAEDAATLGIIDKYSKLSRMIYDELYNSFGVTVDKARSWIELEGTPEYTRALYQCLIDTSGSTVVEEDYQVEENLPFEMTPEDNSVINAEEKDL